MIGFGLGFVAGVCAGVVLCERGVVSSEDLREAADATVDGTRKLLDQIRSGGAKSVEPVTQP